MIDAQLPRRLVTLLRDLGHDAVHTLDLPHGNRTSDSDVIAAADEEGRVLVSTDRDFRDGYLLGGAPRRLLVVSTGNISNQNLLALFADHLDHILDLFAESHSLSSRLTG